MESFWTACKAINGLRHFVLVNQIKEKGNIVFLMVSVVDAEINLKISQEELLNNCYWEKGWLNLPKSDSITEDYVRYKSIHNKKRVIAVTINDNSKFNIS